jgi:hypothetical protein
MMFLTTTAIELDEELMNRCLVLAVNEDREQIQAKWGWTRVGCGRHTRPLRFMRMALMAAHGRSTRSLNRGISVT